MMKEYKPVVEYNKAERNANQQNSVIFALLAAALYSINSPISKLLLKEIPASMMAALLYLGAGLGMSIISIFRYRTGRAKILSAVNLSEVSFSRGSLFILLGCVCWGVENSCTRMLSVKDPLQVVIIKGFGSGIASLIISIAIREIANNTVYIICALILGFVSYGLSIYFYVTAQRELGAARTSAYYAAAPFLGAVVSFAIFLQVPTISFMVASFFMAGGTYFTSSIKPEIKS